MLSRLSPNPTSTKETWGSPAISVAGQTHFLTEPKSSDEVVPAMGLELAASATPPASFGRFAALSVSCLLLGAGVVLLVFRGDWRDRLVPPPIFVWILLCLAWWLWLTPGWLGPVGLLAFVKAPVFAGQQQV